MNEFTFVTAGIEIQDHYSFRSLRHQSFKFAEYEGLFILKQIKIYIITPSIPAKVSQTHCERTMFYRKIKPQIRLWRVSYPIVPKSDRQGFESQNVINKHDWVL